MTQCNGSWKLFQSNQDLWRRYLRAIENEAYRTVQHFDFQIEYPVLAGEDLIYNSRSSVSLNYLWTTMLSLNQSCANWRHFVFYIAVVPPMSASSVSSLFFWPVIVLVAIALRHSFPLSLKAGDEVFWVELRGPYLVVSECGSVSLPQVSRYIPFTYISQNANHCKFWWRIGKCFAAVCSQPSSTSSPHLSTGCWVDISHGALLFSNGAGIARFIEMCFGLHLHLRS